MLSYRVLEAHDFPTIAKWNVELHKDEGSVPMTVADAEAGRFGGIVFNLDAEDIGYLVHENLAADPELRGSHDAIYIRQFFIKQSKRRCGLGRNAFHLFQEVCNPTNLAVVLDVKATNPDGQKFWVSMGFQAQHTHYALQD